MSFQVSKILRHCCQLPSLINTLDTATQPRAKSLASTLGVDFRRGFAEDGRKPPTQNEGFGSNSPLDEAGLPKAGSRDPKPTTSSPPQPDAASGDADQSQFTPGGVLDLGEVLDNTFKVLKSRTSPLVVDTPPQSPGLLRMLSDSVRAYISSLFITRTIETSHNDEEFLMGAGDAFRTVFEMVHDKDWKALEPMMSPGALRGLKQTFEAHAKNGLQLNFLPARDVEPQHALFSLMHRSMIARFGETVEEEDSPGETPPAAPASPGTATAALDPPTPSFDVSRLISQFPKPQQYYQTATVAFKAKLEAEVKREEDGQVVLKSTDSRRQVWIFARGPLPPELPRRELDLQWKLLAML